MSQSSRRIGCVIVGLVSVMVVYVLLLLPGRAKDVAPEEREANHVQTGRTPAEEDSWTPRSSNLPVTPASATGPTVSGMAVDQDSRPLAGVSLKVFSGDNITRLLLGKKPILETQSGADGTFALKFENGGVAYELKAELDGYSLVSMEKDGVKVGLVGVVPKYDVAGVKLVMASSGTITGRVVDMSGQAMARVLVCASLQYGDAGPPLVAEKATDEKGQFRVSGLAAAAYGLWGLQQQQPELEKFTREYQLGSASAPLATVSVGPGKWRQEVLLRAPADPARLIEGRVMDEAGKALDGVTVWAVPAMNERLCAQADEKTPATGAFRVTRIPEKISDQPGASPVEAVTVHAERDGYEPGQVEEVPVGTRNLELILGPEALGTITCRLFDAQNGETVIDAKVLLAKTVTGEGRVRQDAQQIRSGPAPDAQGWFTFEKVPAGESTLSILSARYGLLWKPGIAVAKGETTRVEIPLQPAGMLCVHVVGMKEKMVDGVYVTPVSGKPPIPEDIAPTGAIMGYYNKQHATIAAFQPTLQCGCRQVEKSDEHQDFMLAPGKYLVSMQRLIAVPGATAAQRTTWYKTVRVEVVSGSVSPVVWNHDNPTEYGSVTMETDPDTPSITPVYLYSGPAARWREALSGAQNAGTGIEGEYFTGFTDGKSAVFHYVPPGSYTVAVRVGSGRAATAQVRVSVGVVTEVGSNQFRRTLD